MVLDDFTPSKTRTKLQRKIRTKKYLLELAQHGNTKDRTTDLNKFKRWLMGILVIDVNEFNEVLEELIETNKIKVVGGLIITD